MLKLAQKVAGILFDFVEQGLDCGHGYKVRFPSAVTYNAYPIFVLWEPVSEPLGCLIKQVDPMG